MQVADWTRFTVRNRSVVLLLASEEVERALHANRDVLGLAFRSVMTFSSRPRSLVAAWPWSTLADAGAIGS